ncbi:MAG: HPr family phosphocarrier protein [Pseudomonadota bacterium]
MELIKKIRIVNNLGLHARAAAKIVSLVGVYQSQLFLRKDGQEVDGSSILSILTLSCPKGTDIELRVVGDDSEAMMGSMTELIENKFGEDR